MKVSSTPNLTNGSTTNPNFSGFGLTNNFNHSVSQPNGKSNSRKKENNELLLKASFVFFVVASMIFTGLGIAKSNKSNSATNNPNKPTQRMGLTDVSLSSPADNVSVSNPASPQSKSVFNSPSSASRPNGNQRRPASRVNSAEITEMRVKQPEFASMSLSVATQDLESQTDSSLAILISNSDEIQGNQPYYRIISITSSTVASRHAIIQRNPQDGTYTIMSINSDAETKVNGQSLEAHQKTIIKEGDILSFGDVNITFQPAFRKGEGRQKLTVQTAITSQKAQSIPSQSPALNPSGDLLINSFFTGIKLQKINPTKPQGADFISLGFINDHLGLSPEWTDRLSFFFNQAGEGSFVYNPAQPSFVSLAVPDGKGNILSMLIYPSIIIKDEYQREFSFVQHAWIVDKEPRLAELVGHYANAGFPPPPNKYDDLMDSCSNPSLIRSNKAEEYRKAIKNHKPRVRTQEALSHPRDVAGVFITYNNAPNQQDLSWIGAVKAALTNVNLNTDGVVAGVAYNVQQKPGSERRLVPSDVFTVFCALNPDACKEYQLQKRPSVGIQEGIFQTSLKDHLYKLVEGCLNPDQHLSELCKLMFNDTNSENTDKQKAFQGYLNNKFWVENILEGNIFPTHWMKAVIYSAIFSDDRTHILQKLGSFEKVKLRQLVYELASMKNLINQTAAAPTLKANYEAFGRELNNIS